MGLAWPTYPWGVKCTAGKVCPSHTAPGRTWTAGMRKFRNARPHAACWMCLCPDLRRAFCSHQGFLDVSLMNLGAVRWEKNPPHKLPSRGMRGLGLPFKNRHLGVCRRPPVASLQCRRPAHPLVSVSMGCWFASWRHAKAFSIRLQLVQAPGSRAAISYSAPMEGAPPDNIGAKRMTEGSVPASVAGTATVR